MGNRGESASLTNPVGAGEDHPSLDHGLLELAGFPCFGVYCGLFNAIADHETLGMLLEGAGFLGVRGVFGLCQQLRDEFE